MSKASRRSAQQSAASRTNGAKSRGPVSSTGKARSARNSKAHGLTGKLHVTDDEQSEAELLAAKLIARFGSGDPRVAALIDRVVVATMRLHRARVLITQALEDLADPQNSRRLSTQEMNAEILASVSGLMQEVFGGEPPDMQLAEVLAEDAGFVPIVARPNRTSVIRLMDYARRFRGERDRALNRLEGIRMNSSEVALSGESSTT